MPLSEQERAVAITGVINESIPPANRPPDQEIQFQLANEIVEKMDVAFGVYQQTITDSQSLGGTLQTQRVDFVTRSTLQQLNICQGLFGATQDKVSHGRASTEASGIVNDFGRAYKSLITQSDPDGWFGEFLENHQKFAEHIGGRPPWLPPLTQK